MKNRAVETLYRVRDGATAILRKVTGGWKQNASAAEASANRIEAANQRQTRSANSLLASIGRLRFAYFAAAGALTAVFASIRSFARAASDQETAEARLETAIRNGVGATEEQIQALKDLAAERQRVTRFGDEQTISAQAQLATFKLTADQIALLTPRVQDLAEASRRLGQDNVDLESSAILVGKALSGNAGSLSRYGVVLSDAQKEALRFGDTQERIAALTEALDANFAGLSTSLPPFELALQSASNGFGDFKEKLGEAITQNPAVVDALTGMADGFAKLGDSAGKTTEFIGRFVAGALTSFRILGNTANIIFNTILLGANRLQAGILETAQGIASGLATVTFGSARETLNKFVSDVDKQLEELETSSAQRFENVGESVAGFLEAGSAANDILFGQAEAQDAVNTATREGLAITDEAAEAEQRRQSALDRTAAALERFKVDIEEAETGIRSASRESINALIDLARDGEVSLAVLGAAAENAGKDFNQIELRELQRQLRELFATGQLNVGQFKALRLGLRDLEDGSEDTAKTMKGLAESISSVENFQQLGDIAKTIRELGESGELSAEQIKQLNIQLQKQIELMGQTGDETEEVGEQTEELGDKVEKVAEQTDKASESFGGFGAAVANILASWRDLSESAAAEVDKFVKESAAGVRTAESFFKRLAEFTREMANEQSRQAEAADRVIERVEAASDATVGAKEAAALLRSELQLLDETRLDQLTGIVQEAKRSTEAFLDSVTDRNRQLQDEIARVQGKEEELARLRDEERRKQIQDQIRDARVAGNLDLLKQLEQQLKLEDQLTKAKKEQAEVDRKAQQERERSGGTGTASSGPAGQSETSGASGGRAVVDVVRFETSFGPFEVAANQRQPVERMIELLRRSAGNSLPPTSP